MTALLRYLKASKNGLPDPKESLANSRPASIILENLPIMLSGISQKSSLLCPSISLLCLKSC